MDLMEVQELIKGKIGLRIKQESDCILIYGNAWTIIVDINKWIKLKLNKFICLQHIAKRNERPRNKKGH